MAAKGELELTVSLFEVAPIAHERLLVSSLVLVFRKECEHDLG